ncbi:MAG TPA: transketolase, partial [Solirubrobacterales bacterium]|nr:transketolase [Solirubrobacterales bacterium]
MALAPVAHVLYSRIMRHSPRHPQWPARDRFILSAGHASMLLYSTLYLQGYDIELDDLKNFRQLGSPTAGHPEYLHAPGVEITTGPLGQGISHSVGMALGERMLATRFDRDGFELLGHRTFVIASDGDMEEGISSEASSLAGHLGLGRMVVFYDQNHITIEGDTDLALSEDVGARYRAYGWHVQDLGEDVELDSIENATRAAIEVDDAPSLIIVRTHIAPGAPNKQDTAGAHGAPLGAEEIELTKKAYGFPSLEPFFVPEEVRDLSEKSVERGDALVAKWEDSLEQYRAAHPELATEFERILAHQLPKGWEDQIPMIEDTSKQIATRKASQMALQWIAAEIPELVGGSADLAPSTLTEIDGAESVKRGSYGGRNLHFGIREHAMGATVNGLNLAGLRAYGATFLVFSDYMKPAIRLAALMNLPSIFVYTHDSIGLGEDGPTHQPVEHLWALRAIPNCNIVRPADANETVLAWKFAVRQTSTPTLFALSRQNLPVIEPSLIPPDAIERGAYVLRESSNGADLPDLILIGTGSEVPIALAAAEILEEEGIATRVVSAPCIDAFAQTDSEYQDMVLPPEVRARVSIEAGSTIGWHRWITDDGFALGLDGFGASAPQPVLYEHFGFTPDNLAAHGRAVARGKVPS